MPVLERLHQGYVHPRRVRVLSRRVAALIARGSAVLDVGCGDGWLDRAVQEQRPDLLVRGLDVSVRPDARIPVTPFDGRSIPCGDGSVDVVLLVDVLHHTPDPLRLLREATRVARAAIIIKDHTCEGILARPLLRLMDWVGNARHGVALPYVYWRKQQWLEAFEQLGLAVTAWEARLGLYPWPANLLFERSLHFLARLERRRTA